MAASTPEGEPPAISLNRIPLKSLDNSLSGVQQLGVCTDSAD